MRAQWGQGTGSQCAHPGLISPGGGQPQREGAAFGGKNQRPTCAATTGDGSLRRFRSLPRPVASVHQQHALLRTASASCPSSLTATRPHLAARDPRSRNGGPRHTLAMQKSCWLRLLPGYSLPAATPGSGGSLRGLACGSCRHGSASPPSRPSRFWGMRATFRRNGRAGAVTVPEGTDRFSGRGT
jgi:hypothetical protein